MSRKRLVTRESLARREWANLPISVICITLSIAQIYSQPNPPSSAYWSWGSAIAFWIGVAVRIVYYNLRWLPIIRKLLESPKSEVPIGPAIHSHDSAPDSR